MSGQKVSLPDDTTDLGYLVVGAGRRFGKTHGQQVLDAVWRCIRVTEQATDAQHVPLLNRYLGMRAGLDAASHELFDVLVLDGWAGSVPELFATVSRLMEG